MSLHTERLQWEVKYICYLESAQHLLSFLLLVGRSVAGYNNAAGLVVVLCWLETFGMQSTSLRKASEKMDAFYSQTLKNNPLEE